MFKNNKKTVNYPYNEKKGGWNQIFQPPFIGILNLLLLSPAKLFGFDYFSFTRNPANINSLFQRFGIYTEFMTIRNIGNDFS